MKISLLPVLIYILLGVQAGYSQTLKIGISGFERRFSMVPSNINGPLTLNSQSYWYSLGAEATYEKGKNGFQLNVMGLPYKIDLRFKNFLGGVDNGNTLTIYGLSYRRQLLNWQRRAIKMYAQAGITIGQYSYKSTKYAEIHNVILNGNTIFSSSINKESLYDKSIVLFPILKLELEKQLFSHLIISAQATYIFRNLVSYNRPLVEANYQYNYSGQTGSGHLDDYGKGFLLGIGLKWKINLGQKSLE